MEQCVCGWKQEDFKTLCCISVSNWIQYKSWKRILQYSEHINNTSVYLFYVCIYLFKFVELMLLWRLGVILVNTVKPKKAEYKIKGGV